MIGLVNANLAVSIMEDNDTLLSYQNIIKKEISLPYKEREIYIVYDPLNISKLSLDIIQEMLKMFDRFYLSNHRNYDIVYNYLFILKFLYKSENFLWKEVK